MIANLKIRTASPKLLIACVLLALAGTTAFAQQTTGVPGSPDATTTIDGRYIPPPPQKFQGRGGPHTLSKERMKAALLQQMAHALWESEGN